MYKTEIVNIDGTNYTLTPPKGEFLPDAYKVLIELQKANQEVERLKKEFGDDADVPFPIPAEAMGSASRVILHCLEKKHIKDKNDREEIEFMVSQNIFVFIPALLKVIGLSKDKLAKITNDTE